MSTRIWQSLAAVGDNETVAKAMVRVMSAEYPGCEFDATLQPGGYYLMQVRSKYEGQTISYSDQQDLNALVAVTLRHIRHTVEMMIAEPPMPKPAPSELSTYDIFSAINTPTSVTIQTITRLIGMLDSYRSDALDSCPRDQLVAVTRQHTRLITALETVLEKADQVAAHAYARFKYL